MSNKRKPVNFGFGKNIKNFENATETIETEPVLDKKSVNIFTIPKKIETNNETKTKEKKTIKFTRPTLSLKEEFLDDFAKKKFDKPEENVNK